MCDEIQELKATCKEHHLKVILETGALPNKGAPGIDGMTIEEALPYLKEHQQELTDRIYRGKYTPSPVRRVEIPLKRGLIALFYQSS